jgi:hypothetical protein
VGINHDSGYDAVHIVAKNTPGSGVPDYGKMPQKNTFIEGLLQRMARPGLHEAISRKIGTYPNGENRILTCRILENIR